jgi:hypothetical protein
MAFSKDLGLSLALVAMSSLSAMPPAASPPASIIPATTGTALDGHAVSLPRDLSPHATILILGFTKHSQDPTTAWEKAVRASLSGPGIDYLDMPFLEDAPRFVRPMILRGIQKQVPDIVKAHFVPLTSGETAWKQAAAFNPTTPDAAYVLLVDRRGAILWKTREPWSPALFDQLSHATRDLVAHESASPQTPHTTAPAQPSVNP